MERDLQTSVPTWCICTLLPLLVAGCNDVTIRGDAICDGELQATESAVDAPFHQDQDGFLDARVCDEAHEAALLDCNDPDAGVHPGARVGEQVHEDLVGHAGGQGVDAGEAAGPDEPSAGSADNAERNDVARSGRSVSSEAGARGLSSRDLDLAEPAGGRVGRRRARLRRRAFVPPPVPAASRAAKALRSGLRFVDDPQPRQLVVSRPPPARARQPRLRLRRVRALTATASSPAPSGRRRRPRRSRRRRTRRWLRPPPRTSAS